MCSSRRENLYSSDSHWVILMPENSEPPFFLSCRHHQTIWDVHSSFHQARFSSKRKLHPPMGWATTSELSCLEPPSTFTASPLSQIICFGRWPLTTPTGLNSSSLLYFESVVWKEIPIKETCSLVFILLTLNLHIISCSQLWEVI